MLVIGLGHQRGVGKSTYALELRRRILHDYPTGCFVAISPIALRLKKAAHELFAAGGMPTVTQWEEQHHERCKAMFQDNTCNPRQILLDLGAFVRERSDDVLLSNVFSEAKNFGVDVLIIPDVRTAKEFTALRSLPATQGASLLIRVKPGNPGDDEYTQEKIEFTGDVDMELDDMPPALWASSVRVLNATPEDDQGRELVYTGLVKPAIETTLKQKPDHREHFREPLDFGTESTALERQLPWLHRLAEIAGAEHHGLDAHLEGAEQCHAAALNLLNLGSMLVNYFHEVSLVQIEDRPGQMHVLQQDEGMLLGEIITRALALVNVLGLNPNELVEKCLRDHCNHIRFVREKMAKMAEPPAPEKPNQDHLTDPA